MWSLKAGGLLTQVKCTSLACFIACSKTLIIPPGVYSRKYGVYILLYVIIITSSTVITQVIITYDKDSLITP